jgi:trimeric autotransporter adhesin
MQSQKSSSIKTSPQPSLLLSNKSSLFTTSTTNSNANSFAASTPISNNTGDDNIDLINGKYSNTYQTNYTFPTYDYSTSSSFTTSNTYQPAGFDSTQFSYAFQPLNNDPITSDSYNYSHATSTITKPYNQFDYWSQNYTSYYPQFSTLQQKLSPELNDTSNNATRLSSFNYTNFDSSTSPTATYPRIQYQHTSPISTKQQLKTINSNNNQEAQQTSTPIISSNSSSLSCASSVSSLSISKEQAINISPPQETNSSTATSTTTTTTGTSRSSYDWLKTTSKPVNGKLRNSIFL